MKKVPLHFHENSLLMQELHELVQHWRNQGRRINERNFESVDESVEGKLMAGVLMVNAHELEALVKRYK